MSCINPKQPIFQKILGLTNNPLKSEFIYDDMMDIIGKESLYNSYGDKLSNAIAEDIMLESPAMKRESPNVYSIHLVQDSNKINTLEQAYEVAKERASKINTKYSKGIRDIARVTTEKGDIRVIIEPNKQHVSDYIIKELIKGEEDKKSEGYANISNNEVKYIIKAVEILQSDKAKQIFDKGYKNNWSIDKILIELAIPKEQRELINSIIASLYKKETLSSNLPDWRNDIIVDLITNYSYTVEINTAKTQYKQYNIEPEPGIPYEVTNRGDIEEGENTSYYSNLTVPGGTNYTENEISTPLITPSIKGHAQFATDKGIGWFRSDEKRQDELTNNGNWVKSISEVPNEFYYNKGKIRVWKDSDGNWNEGNSYIEDNQNVVHKYNQSLGNKISNTETTKTRRILELQSDLFQKGRDKKNLITSLDDKTGYGGNQATAQEYRNTIGGNENQFLQLLNKDNNWVTFFIKSIIQDSAKKGYEKVLFPTGETASKVEGHETLTNELKQIDKDIEKNKFLINKRLEEEANLISRIENNIKNDNYLTIEKLGYRIINDPSSTSSNPPKVAALINKKTGEFVLITRGYSNPIFANEKNAEETFNAFIKGNKIVDLNNKSIELKNISELKDLDTAKYILDRKEERLFDIKNNSLLVRELSELEEEKSNLKSQGIEKLKPIHAFYEIKVTNILKKQGYNPKVITDEYGNTWNEVTIDENTAIKPILLQLQGNKQVAIKKADKFNEVLKNIAKNIGVDVKFVESLINKHGNTLNGLFKVTNDFKGLIQISKDSTDDLALSEELSHAIIDGFEQLPVVQNILKLIKAEGYAKFLGDNVEAYEKMYNGNKELLIKEAAGKALSQALYNNFEQDSESRLIKALKAFWTRIKSIFNKVDTQSISDLDNALNELSRVILGEELTTAEFKSETIMASIDLKKGFPMMESSIAKLEGREKTFTIRTRKHTPGYYRLGDNFYNISLVNEGGSIISDFKDPEYFKKKFTGDDEIKFDHIKDFFEGKTNMYVYQIVKVSDTIKNQLQKEELRKTPKLTKRDPYEEQLVNMKRNIGRLKAKLAVTVVDSEQYETIKSIITNTETKIAQYNESKNESYITEAGRLLLEESKLFVDAYEETGKLPSAKELQQITNFLQSIAHISPLAQEVSLLIARFNEIQKIYVESLANEALNKQDSTYEDLTTEDKKDISLFTKSFNSLMNLKDKLAYVIGFLIKRAQIEISSKQGELYNVIKDQVDSLSKWAKDNNIPSDKMYDIFIQNYRGTTILTREYTEEFYTKINDAFKKKDYDALNKVAYKNEETGKWTPYDTKKYRNENYHTILKEPALKSFYEFYEKTIKESLNRLPKNETKYLGEDFIPNIMLNSFSDAAKATTFGGKLKNLMKYTTNINSTEVLKTDFLKNEALDRDLVPLKYLKKITGDKKSTDLGESLFKFAAFTIEHEHLSEILPQTRILHNAIGESSYISSTSPLGYKKGVDTNLYEMVDRFIDMQLRGNKKKDFYKLNVGDVVNDKGEVIGTKQVDIADAIDFGLTWNSLLRIGLNPITAVTNVLVGESGNIIEAIGGRFFNKSELNTATGIFFKDITDKDSKFNSIIEKYPLMQELTDYEYAGKLRVAKGLTGEKLKNYMYQMQKSGEVFLQGRTMIAMMLHIKPDGKTALWEMLDDKGALKSEFKDAIPDFNDYMIRMSTKIMGVNEKIHGRYSSRDAAIINQNVLWRMMFQFKKWIPAAIEARFEEKRYDERLGVEVEGRWITLVRLVRNLKDTATRIDRGELSELEIYNMKKTATEAALILGSILMYAALGWDDDDKKKRSAMYKFTMDQLDRISGDLLFMANPRNVTSLSKNPIAMTKLADDLISVTRNIPYIFHIGKYEYESGPRKGENKFWSKAGAVTPGLKPTQDVLRLFNEEKYRDYTP